MMATKRKYDTANAVVLTGNELGAGLSFNKLWDKARLYARDHFAGEDKEFTIASVGYNVKIPMAGVRHTLDFAKTRDDIYAVIALPQLLERAIWDENREDYKKRQNVDHLEVYYSSLQIGENKYIAEMIVRVDKGETKNGNLSFVRFFHHQIIEGLEDQ